MIYEVDITGRIICSNSGDRFSGIVRRILNQVTFSRLFPDSFGRMIENLKVKIP
jgi:hypothetical protein